jgi:hypothetical protein
LDNKVRLKDGNNRQTDRQTEKLCNKKNRHTDRKSIDGEADTRAHRQTLTNLMYLSSYHFISNQGYGIAISQSEYKPLIDSAILHVQESGALHKLNVKWWKQKRGGG